MDSAVTLNPRPSLNRIAFSATLHCLTGCAVGEVLGMVTGTILQWNNTATIVLAIVLAFLFGYSLTLLPLVRSGVPVRTALWLAFASDTLSITIMEVIDNTVMLFIPGAMAAGLSQPLFWVSLLLSLVLAGMAAFPVNRWLIARGRGHALVHGRGQEHSMHETASGRNTDSTPHHHPHHGLILFAAAITIIACTHPNPSDPSTKNDNDGITAVPLARAVDYDAVYVVNGGDHSITVINAQTDSVTGVVRLGGATYPHHVYLSPDRSKLAISMPGMDMSGGHHGGMRGMKGAVVVLEATTGRLAVARIMANMNHNSIFSPDGNEIWTGGMIDSGMVYVLNSTTLQMTDSMRAGNSPQEVTFDKAGRYAFVCNGISNSVSVFNRAGRIHLKDIAVDSDPVGAWPGDNGMMYVDNEVSRTISAIDTATLTVHHRYNLGFTPGMAATGPDSTLWITDSDNGRVVINKIHLDMKVGEIVTGSGAHGIVFSGDKVKCYVTNQSAGTVSVIDVSTKSVLKTIPVGNKPNGLTWRKN